MNPGQRVRIIDPNRSCQLWYWNVGKIARFVRMIGVFAMVDIDEVGIRCVLPECLEEVIDSAGWSKIAERFEQYTRRCA